MYISLFLAALPLCPKFMLSGCRRKILCQQSQTSPFILVFRLCGKPPTKTLLAWIGRINEDRIFIKYLLEEVWMQPCVTLCSKTKTSSTPKG